MPNKRRPPASRAGPEPEQKKPARASKIARENSLTAEEEAEIKEAFRLFAVPSSEDFPNEKEGVIAVSDVRRALIALGLPPSDKEEMREILAVLDPTDTGFVPYPPFVSVSALKMHSRTSASQSAEIEEAFNLFTRGAGRAITINHLKRIAREIKEDVSDEQLRDMILEANGGSGVGRGVGMDDFEGLMRRAGVFK